MITRGVCGIWRFRRKSSTRKVTAKESTTSTSTPTGPWLLLGKVHTVLLHTAFRSRAVKVLMMNVKMLSIPEFNKHLVVSVTVLGSPASFSTRELDLCLVALLSGTFSISCVRPYRLSLCDCLPL